MRFAFIVSLFFATRILATADHPNILLILADDLGYGDVACYNPEAKVATPHLDQLAKEGMRFTDAHSPSTVCTPTRYSLLTGHMAFRLNFRGVFTGAGGPCLITKDRLTLPQMLRQAGYQTAMFGKWHIGLTFRDKDGKAIHRGGLDPVREIDDSRPFEGGPLDRGFDQFFGTACCPTTDWLYAYLEGNRVPVPPVKQLEKTSLPNHPWSFDCRPGMVAPDFDLEQVDQVFLRKSLAYLDRYAAQKTGKPFFLFHSLQAVHLPSFPAPEFQGKTKAGPHGDFIFQCDHVIGSLVQKLKTLGLADNTLVIVTSDNGPEVGTVVKMRQQFQHDGARPWRGMKRDNWEGGHRVPMIARWPGRVPSGSICRETLCLTDIMATCATLVGADLPHEAAEDSFDFSPALLGKTTQAIRPYTLHQTNRLALAIRKGKWKYLDHQGSGGNSYRKAILKPFVIPETAPEAPGQLYDLEKDPGETTNLYQKHPEVVRELKALLDETRKRGRSAPAR